MSRVENSSITSCSLKTGITALIITDSAGFSLYPVESSSTCVSCRMSPCFEPRVEREDLTIAIHSHPRRWYWNFLSLETTINSLSVSDRWLVSIVLVQGGLPRPGRCFDTGKKGLC